LPGQIADKVPVTLVAVCDVTAHSKFEHALRSVAAAADGPLATAPCAVRLLVSDVHLPTNELDVVEVGVVGMALGASPTSAPLRLVNSHPALMTRAEDRMNMEAEALLDMLKPSGRARRTC
jgi:hypothetical protein